MEWVANAEEYIGSYGWGARGKYLGVSRMFGEGDKTSLSRNKWVASVRPRGVLSGFLAIVPGTGAVYLPPIAAKVSPQRMRLRVSEDVLEKGAVFSAYLTRDSPRRCVIEDVLVWDGEPVWSTRTFSWRWNHIMKLFVTQKFKADTFIQGFVVELANYLPLAALAAPSDRHVVEFIPEDPCQKRLIWMPTAAAPVNEITVSATPALQTSSSGEFTARKETGMGPDVYAVFRGEERLGLALVRTLAVSRSLRLASGGSGHVKVRAEYNKGFDKWEVQEVISGSA